ncbi:MAG: hypothetical protein HQK58_07290 [Deltaproteobacteria bacterium]|nr:hypothetical protein [Deltaproteobacteria bacterium]
MSDNFIRFRAIRKSLDRPFGTVPKGNEARHLNTLASMINGIIASKRTNLPPIASKTPISIKQEIITKRFSRWIDNFNIKEKLYLMPYAIELLAALSPSEITLAMDGSTVGRNCICLMVSVIYKNRALPLAWFVIEGSKGHLPEIMHLDLRFD